MDLQLTTTIGMYNLYIQHTTGAMNNGQWTMAERRFIVPVGDVKRTEVDLRFKAF